MEIKINWREPIFNEATAAAITPIDTEDFYVKANEIDRLNLYFELEASFHKYASEGKDELAAHLAFLIAFYLFIVLTPPASCELALHYINEALRLNPLPEYEEWLENIKEGN